MLRRVALLVPAVLIGWIPAPAALSVRPDRCSTILVRTPVLCTSYESKPIKHQVTIDMYCERVSTNKQGAVQQSHETHCEKSHQVKEYKLAHRGHRS